MWLVVLLFVLLTALQEFSSAERRTAASVLLQVWALLVMQAIGLVSNGFTGFSTARPVLTYTLLPGCAVSGWLRYYSRRGDPSRERLRNSYWELAAPREIRSD
jgi:hypothetical protein